MTDRAVLVADDDADNRAIVCAVLRRAGYLVHEARDGAEAVELAAAHVPDLVLLDMAMPLMSGLDAARRLKSLERTKGIPILAFTAFALAGDETKCLEAGCDGYITKPCLPRDVLARVRASLEGR